MELTAEQKSRIDDVRYTLNFGVSGGWVNPKSSLDACIEVLKSVKESLKSGAIS